MIKKSLKFLSVVALSVGLAGCSNNDDSKKETSTSGSEETSKKIETLSIGFVPSKDPDEIVTATEPLKDLLKEELKKQGYDVGKIDISVGTSFEAVGESLDSGTLDIGFIPGGTYVLYEKGAEPILTATRAGLSIDADDAKTWNDEKPTEATDKQVNSYRALMITGPSSKGQAVADKVNKGEEVKWDELNDLSWSVMSSSSPAGYIYPSLWLSENYDKNLSDLKNIVQSDSYGSAFARLAAGQVDVVLTYADARRDFAEKWTSEYGRKDDIWKETNVIGVTPAIYNDTISVSTQSKNMTDELKTALQEAFINIADTEKGKEVIAIYTHEGYTKAKPSDYDNERKAQKLVQESK